MRASTAKPSPSSFSLSSPSSSRPPHCSSSSFLFPPPAISIVVFTLAAILVVVVVVVVAVLVLVVVVVMVVVAQKSFQPQLGSSQCGSINLGFRAQGITTTTHHHAGVGIAFPVAAVLNEMRQDGVTCLCPVFHASDEGNRDVGEGREREGGR
ncbi:hypothetical protein EX30DRAFT_348817 [Ascodesmis nigricans]|uniref:Uncharacterized protein n=1 Tax=Ascodesmis nigricans TaxID=341454 RepID=A0A4V3SIT5_9PEZI|nr:hypothetical protein EX30DRAFT_348817 [Ascodesmis nigricans]